MTLREDLKNYVPMYLWEKIEHPEGFVVSNEEYNMRWNLLQVQGDHQANAIRDTLTLLYNTVLDDVDGASHIKVNLVEYDANNLKDVLLLIHRRLVLDSDTITVHKQSGDHDVRYYTKEQLDARKWGTNNIADGAITAVKLDPNLIKNLELVQYIGIAETIQYRLELISILGV